MYSIQKGVAAGGGGGVYSAMGVHQYCNGVGSAVVVSNTMMIG